MKLAITADDFGLDPAVNRGIVDLARQGALSSVSLMLHRDASLEGLSELVATGVALGAHLVFVEERPLVSADDLNGLLNSDGRLPSNWKELLTGLLFRPRWAAALGAEAAAQLDRFHDLGLSLSFINSHQHVHLFPPLWLVLKPLFAKYPSAFVRFANSMRPGFRKQAMVDLSGAISYKLSAPANPTTYPLGIDAAGHFDHPAAVSALLRAKLMLLAGLAPELVVHPGHEPLTNREQYAHWRYQWEEEAAFLSSNVFLDMLRQQNLEIEFPT